MSISRQNLTVVIVSFMSENVIHDCIQSIPGDIKIIVVDNSNNYLFKETIEKKYSNTTCILSENVGMGSGNNLGLRQVLTDFAFILNPDVILKEKTIDEIINASSILTSFGIIAPILDQENFPNFIRELQDNPELANNPNVQEAFGITDLSETTNQRLVEYDDGTLDFFTKGQKKGMDSVQQLVDEFGISFEEATKIKTMEPEDQVLEIERLRTLLNRDKPKNAEGGLIGLHI